MHAHPIRRRAICGSRRARLPNEEVGRGGGRRASGAQKNLSPFPESRRHRMSPPGITRDNATLQTVVPARPCPVVGRAVHHAVDPLSTARYFSVSPSGSTSRRTLCPPLISRSYTRLRVRLGCVRRFRLRARSGVSLIELPRPARRYPRFRIWRPLPGRQWDSNPPDLGTARHTLRPLLTSRSGSFPSPFQALGEISPR